MRIAIYSRKSKFTGKGDSIENQVQMCKDYISTHFGNDHSIQIYEDEGFSGGNLDRPQFQQLLKSIKSKKIDSLICYRLDRISRNVADFSTTLEILQENNCSFISIKEQFDTSTPMGRAMVHIASVFAQLERETIAERIKDNMLETAKNGNWTGGKIPIGFVSKKISYVDDKGLNHEKTILMADFEEKEFVKQLYLKYLELGSLHKLEVYVTQNELKSRSGSLFEKSTLKIILQNPVYVKADDNVLNYLKENNWMIYGVPDGLHSLLTYNKTEQSKKNGKYVKVKKPLDERFAAVSSVEGFIDSDLWLKVQRQFDKNRDTFPRLGKTHNALLTGKLRCGLCGEYMLIHHGRVKSNGEKSFYYTCSLKRKSKKTLCNNSNANAKDIETLVLLSLKNLALNKKDFLSDLKSKYNSNLNSNNKEVEKLSLNKSLELKKSQIDTLVTKLSLSTDLDEVLMPKILSLKSECNDLQIKLNSIEIDKNKSKLEMLNIDLIDSILDDCLNIELLDRNTQRKIIDMLIDTIYWCKNDNKKGRIKIKFIGADDASEDIDITPKEIEPNMLQFGSPSMTCV